MIPDERLLNATKGAQSFTKYACTLKEAKPFITKLRATCPES